MSAGGPSSRHRAREIALQTLYAIELGDVSRLQRVRDGRAPGCEGASEPLSEALDPVRAKEVFAGVAAHFEAPPGAREFAWLLISEVCERGASLDALIAARARNWRLSRMAAVDRNILRLGTYELAHTDTPAAVVMDEAVELARRFGSDASPAFVNGILDALAHELREVEP